MAGIEASKSRPLSRLLAALNIRHVGASTAEDLAEHFGTIHALAQATIEELEQVHGVGSEVAKSICKWFEGEHGRAVIADLARGGVNMTQPRRRAVSDALAGKTVVVTGTMNKYSRAQMEELVKQHGGKVSGSVSKKTDYVVVGQDAGSKLEKAREMGIAILDEAAFDALIGA